MQNPFSNYSFPQDLKNMSERELDLLSYEIRDFLLENVSKTGGHLASNLGIVELTIALHTVFDSPKDKIIWDVGHQAYVHKILTGRAAEFSSLRQTGGLSGFPRRSESPHDMHDSGHSSTSISIAAGYAVSRDLNGEDYAVVSVIGDGALTGGVAYEALNCAGNAKTRMIVILNDNEMSIGKNVGGMSQHLGKLRASHAYLDFKKKLKTALKGIPGVGEGLYYGMQSIRDLLKYALVPGAIFEELGFKYFGPVDGHDIHDLLEILQLAKSAEDPILIHAVTKKGKGYRNAERFPGKFHGIGPFDLNTGEPLASKKEKTYSELFGEKLCSMAEKDSRITAISAAMTEATGLSKMKKRFPERTFDVGIAEQHAVAFAAGQALAGLRPFVAIYSTFLQRAYDEILMDVCMENLPVVFAVDRAGNVGNDGETHHGVFDLSYFSSMPNMTVMAPKDRQELAAMMDYAMSVSGPCAIRYPRGEAPELTELVGLAEPAGRAGFAGAGRPINGRMELLLSGLPDAAEAAVGSETAALDGSFASGSAAAQVCIFAIGNMVKTALSVCGLLRQRGVVAELYNVRFLKPFDEETFRLVAARCPYLVTMEDNVLTGGLYSAAAELLARADGSGSGSKERGSDNSGGKPALLGLGWPDAFIPHGAAADLMKIYGLDAESAAERVVRFIEGKA